MTMAEYAPDSYRTERIMPHKHTCTVLCLLAGGSLAAQAAAPPTGEAAETLAPIQVTAPRLTRDWLDTPSAITTVATEDIQQGRQHLQLDESLNRVPGVYFQNRYNFAQDIRMSIRGFGARAPFGIRGVRLMMDGFPETTPDGQSQVDAIDLLSVRDIEVLRGPHSALYGNATGGVLNITTEPGGPETTASARGELGSYGFQRTALQGGGQEGPWNYHLSAWHLDYEGYRDQSEARKSLVRANVGHQLNERTRVTGVFHYLDAPKTEDPGGLTRDEVRADRRAARDDALTLDAGQDVSQYRVGLALEHELNARDEVSARAFYTRREFEQQLPFLFPDPSESLVGYDRDFYGIGTQYTGQRDLGALPVVFTTGVDAEQQQDARERYESGSAGRGDQVQDQVEKAATVAGYLQGDLLLTDRWTLTLGTRFDRMRFSIDDRLGTGDDDRSGRRTFNEWSHSAGLSYAFHPDHRVYANVGTAFETPTFTEFADPEGSGFNPNVDPQEALSWEVGVKGVWDHTVQYEASLYTARVKDELVPFEAESGREFFRNAGRTRRHGLELGATWFATDQLSVSGAYTHNDFKYRRFEDDEGERFDGNRLPGLPRNTLFAEVAYRESEGVFAVADAYLVDSTYTDDANDTRVSGYGVVNARVGTRSRLGGWTVESFVAVNNLLNKEYFSNIRINADGGRYFDPAPERNVFAGITVRP